MASKGNKTLNIGSEVSKNLTTHTNLDQHILVVNEDKVRLAMIEYDKQYVNNHDWISPLSIAITIIIAIITADFKDFLFFKASVIEAMAYLSFFYFAGKSGINCFYAFKERNNRITHDQMIEKLRENSQTTIEQGRTNS